MTIIDSHCHLQDFRGAAAETWRRANNLGVFQAINVGTNLQDALKARELCRALPGLSLAAGLHPVNADRLAEEWPLLMPICRSDDCVAIGETGLDFYRPTHPTRSVQIAALELHLQLAAERDVPVIIHCRPEYSERLDSVAEIYDLLLAVVKGMPRVKCVLHCFTGSTREAQKAADAGCMISFAGNLTHRSVLGKALRAAAAYAPTEALLVETDAPYVKPLGCSGRRNEPAFITSTLTELSHLRHCTFDEICATTSANARRVFGLEASGRGTVRSGQRICS